MKENEIILRQLWGWLRERHINNAQAMRLADTLDPSKDSPEAYRLRALIELCDCAKVVNRGRKKTKALLFFTSGADSHKIALRLREYMERFKGSRYWRLYDFTAPQALAMAARALIEVGYLTPDAPKIAIRRVLLNLLTGNCDSNDYGSASAFYVNFNKGAQEEWSGHQLKKLVEYLRNN